MKYLLMFSILFSIITFYSCNNSNKTVNDNIVKDEIRKIDKVYIEKGKQIALEAKGILGKNLLQAIHKKGTEGAMTFCSDKAIYLTDSISKALNVSIKRVSDKNRNSINSPNSNELEYINKVKEIISKGDKPSPQIMEEGNKILGYYPIMTNAMCLQCHGQKNIDILPKITTKIDSLYPNDKAKNYKDNELRGIWVIEMMK